MLFVLLISFDPFSGKNLRIFSLATEAAVRKTGLLSFTPRHFCTAEW
jgi:hypothetical protein